LPVPDGHNIVDELNLQAKFAKLRTVSKDVHPANAIWLADEAIPQLTKLEIPNEKNVDVAWNAHCMSGTEGVKLLPGLPKITEYDFIVFKGIEPNLHPYSGVYHDMEKKISTGLVEYYRANRINTIILGGLSFDYCVKDTAFDLLSKGFRVIVNMGATRAIGDVDDTMKLMKEHGITIVDSADDLYEINIGEDKVNMFRKRTGMGRELVCSVIVMLPNGSDEEIIQMIHHLSPRISQL